MKKLLSILLTIALLLTLSATLGGCEKEKKPLRVLVDISMGLDTDTAQIKSWCDFFVTTVKQMDGPADIELEYLPANGSERSIALTRIRTEVMAGGGPDVYILAQSTEIEDIYSAPMVTDNTALFLMPEKIMHNGLLMPLDKYIEKAQFMEWEKLTPAVMEAGQNDNYGQVILPMTYTFPVTCYRASDLPQAPEAYTWSDMVESDDPILLDAAARLSGGVTPIMYTAQTLSDPATRKLTFTQEELLASVQEKLELEAGQNARRQATFESGENGGVTGYQQSDMCVQLQGQSEVLEGSFEASPGWWNNTFIPGLEQGEDLTLIPSYSPEGGITATIQSYACINANTKRPDDAFFVLDVLLSKEVQQSSGIYQWLTELKSVPTYEGIMTEDEVFAKDTPSQWSMSDHTYAQFSALRDQITAARFYGTLDVELMNLECAVTMENADVEKLVEQAYTRMKQEVSE